MAEVILRDITKVYDGHEVVKNVNLEIPDKQFFVLVGPSGCGKSTTLRMIAGLEEITNGQIWIGDRCVNDIPPKDRDIAMVFQNYALYPHMTVYENMAFGLKLRGYAKREIDSRVREAADMLNIKDLLDRKPKALSGGQRQRVAVGRAIVRKPHVFLFDEPLSNLDAKLRVQMRAEISKLHNRLQTTMIYVTHDQIEAMTMGDRICVMKDGVVQQIASPLELYGKPSNHFVAGFIGSPPMNFLNTVVIEQQGAYWLEEGSFRVKVPDNFSKKVRPWVNRPVIFGIRPENVHDKLFYPTGGSEGSTVVATVEVIEPMGAELLLHLKVGRSVIVAKVPPQVQTRVNQPIEVVFTMDRLHLFDPETEQAIL